jgi:hypothetical protein
MGPDSGEEFRTRLLKELKKVPGEVQVLLDGAEGYGSSFLEEAFGGLIRLGLLDPAEALTRIKVRATTPANETYAREAIHYMIDAARRRRG